MQSVLDVILMIRMLLYMLDIITISDANIVGANGLKAGVQVWQKKIKRRLGDGRLYFGSSIMLSIVGWDVYVYTNMEVGYVLPVISERDTEPIPCNCTMLSLLKSFYISEIGYVASTTSHVILGRYCVLFALTNSSNTLSK